MNRRAMFKTLLAAPLLVGASVSLSACGFRPLYGEDNRAAMDDVEILIAPIAEREGQILHNALRDRLNPNGMPFDPSHRMQVKLTNSLGGIDTSDGDNVRRYAQLNGTFTVTPVGAPRPVINSTRSQRIYFAARSDARVNSEDERVAIERGLALLAEDIALAVRSHFIRS